MKILISPAKSFKKVDDLKTKDLIFKKETQSLVDFMKAKSIWEIGNMFKINDGLTEKVYYDYQEFDFEKLKGPALFTYDGLVYKQFDRKDFKDLSYLDDHVYIFSALYGLLKPTTGIRDYRLDMTVKEIDLYDFWKDKIYKEVYKDKEPVLNLASKEYSKLVSKYLKSGDKFVTVNFKDEKNGKLRTVVARTKQMRGKFLKYIIQNKIEDIEKVKEIKIDGYIYDPLLSNDKELYFVRRNQ
jgi:cytoplasmic iron level regulating protein YaaA (DUF328/UPF0246 family)